MIVFRVQLSKKNKKKNKDLSSLRIDSSLPLRAKYIVYYCSQLPADHPPPFLPVLMKAGFSFPQSLSDSSSALRRKVKKPVTDFKATPLPVCSAGSLQDSHL